MSRRSRQLWGTPREWAVRLTIGVATGLFFGALGPFGTYAAPLALRMTCWTTGFCLGMAVFSLTIRWARLLAPRLDLPLWFATGAAVAVACAPLSVAIGLLFNGRYWRDGGWSARLEFYVDCLLIAAPATAGYILLLKQANRPPAGATAAFVPQPPPAPAGAEPAPCPAATASPLLDRLPPRLGRDLIALQMEDHYVRAHTPLGSDLLLLPLSQAVEAVEGVDGLRVHRSWWVARAAVEGAAWEGRNLRLKLRGGLEAPVARTQVAPLRAAGWLDG